LVVDEVATVGLLNYTLFEPLGFQTLEESSGSPASISAGTLRDEVQRPWGKGGEAEAWINRIVVPAASFASRELGRT
jgi:hypothetical protein